MRTGLLFAESSPLTSTPFTERGRGGGGRGMFTSHALAIHYMSDPVTVERTANGGGKDAK